MTHVITWWQAFCLAISILKVVFILVLLCVVVGLGIIILRKLVGLVCTVAAAIAGIVRDAANTPPKTKGAHFGWERRRNVPLFGKTRR